MDSKVSGGKRSGAKKPAAKKPAAKKPAAKKPAAKKRGGNGNGNADPEKITNYESSRLELAELALAKHAFNKDGELKAYYRDGVNLFPALDTLKTKLEEYTPNDPGGSFPVKLSPHQRNLLQMIRVNQTASVAVV